MTPFTFKRKILFAPLVLAGFAAIGFITMTLWNNLMPEIFQLPTIGFWQALGLILLSRLLFGFNGPWKHHHDRRNRLRERLQNMTPDEREAFRRKWDKRRNACCRPKDNETKSTTPS